MGLNFENKTFIQNYFYRFNSGNTKEGRGGVRLVPHFAPEFRAGAAFPTEKLNSLIWSLGSETTWVHLGGHKNNVSCASLRLRSFLCHFFSWRFAPARKTKHFHIAFFWDGRGVGGSGRRGSPQITHLSDPRSFRKASLPTSFESINQSISSPHNSSDVPSKRTVDDTISSNLIPRCFLGIGVVFRSVKGDWRIIYSDPLRIKLPSKGRGL